MNFQKNKFTVDEFLAIPVFEWTAQAPVKTPFLLGQENKNGQKEYLQDLIEELGGVDKLKEQAKQGNKQLRVIFWTKYPDGNLKENGGHIVFPEVGVTIKDDKLVINTGDTPDITVGT